MGCCTVLSVHCLLQRVLIVSAWCNLLFKIQNKTKNGYQLFWKRVPQPSFFFVDWTNSWQHSTQWSSNPAWKLPYNLRLLATSLFVGFLLWRILLRLTWPLSSALVEVKSLAFSAQHSREHTLVQCREQMSGHLIEEDNKGDREIGGGWGALVDSLWSADWWRRSCGVDPGVEGVSDFATFLCCSREFAKRLRLSSTDLWQQCMGQVLTHFDLHIVGHAVGHGCCWGWK